MHIELHMIYLVISKYHTSAKFVRKHENITADCVKFKLNHIFVPNI